MRPHKTTIYFKHRKIATSGSMNQQHFPNLFRPPVESLYKVSNTLTRDDSRKHGKPLGCALVAVPSENILH